MGHVHAGVLQVVRRKHLVSPEERRDTQVTVGLGPDLLRKIVKFTTPQTQAAFDKMALEVRKSHSRTAALQAKLESDLAKRVAQRPAVVGIEPPGVGGAVAVARAANVRLVTRMSDAFLTQVRETHEEHEGERPEEIEGLLEDRVGVSRSRAELIARDQTLKLNSNVVQYRARAAGLSQYRWSGSLDERERPMHRELEGQVFSWDDPPETNEDGDLNHPGEDCQCRCAAALHPRARAGVCAAPVAGRPRSAATTVRPFPAPVAELRYGAAAQTSHAGAMKLPRSTSEPNVMSQLPTLPEAGTRTARLPTRGKVDEKRRVAVPASSVDAVDADRRERGPTTERTADGRHCGGDERVPEVTEVRFRPRAFARVAAPREEEPVVAGRV